MDLNYLPVVIAEENELLADWLSSESWPFHSNSTIRREQALKWIAEGAFDGSNQRSFWILDGDARVGLIKLFDLDDIGDGYPLFDLRLRAAFRGRGIGEQAVKWLSRYLFETWPELDRIEGTTRQDNLGMRRVFIKAGYVKEGHYRKAWGGHDSIHYGLLRADWETGTSTPVDWDDEQKIENHSASDS